MTLHLCFINQQQTLYIVHFELSHSHSIREVVWTHTHQTETNIERRTHHQRTQSSLIKLNQFKSLHTESALPSPFQHKFGRLFFTSGCTINTIAVPLPLPFVYKRWVIKLGWIIGQRPKEFFGLLEDGMGWDSSRWVLRFTKRLDRYIHAWKDALMIIDR